jgi:hypothetical protein
VSLYVPDIVCFFAIEQDFRIDCSVPRFTSVPRRTNRAYARTMSEPSGSPARVDTRRQMRRLPAGPFSSTRLRHLHGAVAASPAGVKRKRCSGHDSWQGRNGAAAEELICRNLLGIRRRDKKGHGTNETFRPPKNRLCCPLGDQYNERAVSSTSSAIGTPGLKGVASGAFSKHSSAEDPVQIPGLSSGLPVDLRPTALHSLYAGGFC